MRSFKIRKGRGGHTYDGVRYTAGQTVDVKDDKLNFVDMFPNKFLEVTKGKKVTPIPPEEEEDDEVEVDEVVGTTGGEELEVTFSKEKEDTAPVESELGENVTAKFGVAVKNGFNVFKDGKKYFVTEEGNINESMNNNPLMKEDVASFIKKQLK
jgi:hypothetical protein